MRKPGWPVWAVVGLLAGAVLACSVSFSTAELKDARLTRDEAGETTTTTYGPEDTFFCVVELENAPDDTQTKAVWSVIEAEGVVPGYTIGEYELESGTGTLTFKVSPQTPWPVGTYRVELYLNDEKEQSLDFTVQ